VAPPQTKSDRRAILVAGPTATGKSGLALALAARFGGVVINADSMQVYRELRVLTARPSEAEEARAPHRLYGHIAAADAYSTGRWLAGVAVALEAARSAGRRPIIVGGTGLYFKALLEGLSPIPPVPDDVRAHWRREAERLGAKDLHQELAKRDPEMAARLNPADPQRVTRALEVLEASGQSLAQWQRTAGTPLLAEAETVRLVLLPERAALQARCDARFDVMMRAGALEEVRALLRLGLSPDLPAMRALGVPPLFEHLAGRLTLEAAVAQAKLETRQYAKRQMTWLKRNMMSWHNVNAQLSVENSTQDFSFIDSLP
jgi:tRNA dimethylallyltransferase